MSSFTAWRGTFLLPQLASKMFSQPRKVWGIVTIIIVIITIIIAYAVLQNSLLKSLKSLKALIILPRARQAYWNQDSGSSCTTVPDVVHKMRQAAFNKVQWKVCVAASGIGCCCCCTQINHPSVHFKYPHLPEQGVTGVCWSLYQLS